jgi:hypothetical protein
VANSDDCDDSDPLEFSGQERYPDSDNDGYGEEGSIAEVSCLRPA